MSNWLDIIGVTEAGVEALPSHLKTLFGKAEIVLAPKRFLAQLAAINGQEHVHWQSPFSAMLEQVRQYRGRPTVILATGDPNWFGIGATLANHLDSEEFTLHPAPSAFQLAGAKMHWALQNVATLSLHGRAVENLHPHVLPQNRILALTSNGKTMVEVARLLAARGYGQSAINVLENLGSDNERLTRFTANEAEHQNIGNFYTLAIQCIPDPDAPLLPAIPGLPDNAFQHDGQLTKRQVRAATLAALAPFPDALLWDVGAGSGSVGIEWMRAARNASAICFEREQSRGKAIALNAKNLGVPGLKTVSGSAPASLGGQPAPDAVFIGGAVADDAVFKACWGALKPGGRLVANAVTLAGQQTLVGRHKEHGGELCAIAISSLAEIGEQSILRPALPVTQWSLRKPAP
ncbi:MAG TPA: precorrin-6y C5,15-methyltransferase (decarboxylating) subunit CbiE [Devosia sp.]|nr:precorrin-6y C5,15-methyltransferase (decarboxylating) subunit CbiE [Devosia sp.]